MKEELKARERLGTREIKEAGKIIARQQSFKQNLALKRIKALSQSRVQRFSQLKRLTPAPMLSQEQLALNNMFAGEQLWGTGENLPVLNNTLTSGGGIIKSGDESRETAQLFGFKW